MFEGAQGKHPGSGPSGKRQSDCVSTARPETGSTSRYLPVFALAGISVLLSLAAASETRPPAEALRIALTADLRGYLEPCDCKAGVLGGFPRRRTVLEDRAPDLVLDAGDLIFQGSPYDLLKLRLMLELDGRLGYAAVNVGRREAEFSKAQILRAAEESPVPLISANLTDEEGQPVLPGHVLVERRGVRVAVVGLLTTEANPGMGLAVQDPLPALRRELRAVRGKVDLLILLGHLTSREFTRLLREVDGIDLVLGGWVPAGSKSLGRLEGVPCFFVQGKGQYLGEVALERTADGPLPLSGHRIVLGPDMPSEQETESRIHAFKLSLRDLDLLRRDEDTSPYVGSAACAACHSEVHRLWAKSRHSRALSVLRPEKGRFDPHCLKCHVTAPGSGGYVSEERTPQFVGIGCEVCHGPSRAHAEATLTESRPASPGSPARSCLACHESDHSRPFHAEERFEAIRHWSKEKRK